MKPFPGPYTRDSRHLAADQCTSDGTADTRVDTDTSGSNIFTGRKGDRARGQAFRNSSSGLTPLVFGGRARTVTPCLTFQSSFDEDVSLEPPSARSSASAFATKRERRRKLAGRSPLPERRHKPEYDGAESHTSSCRDKLQKPVAPRRWGSWVPSLRALVPLTLCYESSSFPWQLGRVLFGLPAREF